MHGFTCASFVYERSLLPVMACVLCRAPCSCASAAAPSLFYPRLFSNLVRFNMHPLLLPHFLRRLCGSVNPTLGVYRLFSLLYAPRFGEWNLPLAEVSATIKVSPIGGVMLLKGFACLLEAGSGNTLGSRMPSWHETERLRVPENPFPPSPVTVLSHRADSPKPGWVFVSSK